MTTMLITDLDFDTADSTLPERADGAEALTIVEFCSIMTRRLGLLAGAPPEDLPGPVGFRLPSCLAG